MQFSNRSISNAIPDIFGNTAGPQADLKLRYDQEVAANDNALKEMEKRNKQFTDDYQLQIEKRALLDQKYAADKKRIDVTQWESTAGIVEGQLGQMAGMMDKGNKEQFEMWKKLSMGQAVIAGALAFMKALSSGGNIYVGMALAGVSAGITAAQVGIIAGQQYEGKALGGSVNANQTYIVGEKGPELFTPGASGMITSNDKLGQGTSFTITNTIDARGADQGVEQRINVAMAKTQQATMAAIYSSMQRGGSFAVASGRVR
jgi:hypothetical protein